ncbi:MAG: efflux RND transporter periplasmic adaptor subunit [Candidatus Nomurabacteria bacterium]|nr:efflux RND transporter periplasmic adaptor subunit [Candidatus Nomurabacteria bacterium]
MIFINKILLILKKKWVVFTVIVALIIVGGVFIFNNKKTVGNIITISHKDFINQVSISGKVVPAESVDLGFKSSAKISQIYFSVGKFVKKGQKIAGLDSGDAMGALEIAKANYEKVVNGATQDDINVAKSAVETAQTNFDAVVKQQDLAVKTAYQNLLNSNLEAISSGSNDSVAPTISGNYVLGKEGQIKINIYYTGSGPSFNISGVSTGSGTVTTINPQPLGDSGLYINFPSTSYSTVSEWIISIPNKKATNYLSNFNAYQSALETENRLVSVAKSNLDEAKSALIFKQSKGRPEDLSSVNGSLLVAQSDYNDRFIFAPFDGIITRMDAKVGEIASLNTPLISMMSSDVFQIESYVPEVSIVQIKLGDKAKVTLDAYGEGVVFNAEVVSIDPAETIRDGVSTYKIKLQFSGKDDRIKSGMTANVSITTFDKPNVIVVPGGVIFDKDGKKFVQIKINEKIEDREVVLGSISALGQAEIVSGLSDGDMVILNPLNTAIK